MDSNPIVTVVTPATNTDLTTLARVKRELDIDDKKNDDILTDFVHEESAGFAGLVGRTLASETVTETFRIHSTGQWLYQSYHTTNIRIDSLRLSRYPVTTISSVTEDDNAPLDPTLYEVDANSGLLYRLDSFGNRIFWWGLKTVVSYTGGYVLPTDVPGKIQSACITLIRNRWFARKRDPAVKVEEITGVAREEFWVGPIGDGLPADVQEAVDLFRDRLL